MKKISLIMIIISSIGIILGQIITFINPTVVSQRITSGSFIGLGIGAILLGIYVLRTKHK